MAEQFANGAQSTLAAAIGAGDTTLAVVSATTFPATGNFRLLIDSELLLVTSVSGAIFTVTRAAEPVAGVQVAAAHNKNALVTEVLTAAALQGLGGGVTSFNTRTGAITLTTGDVTTALTFTPTTSSVVPSTTPAAGQVLVGNAGGTAYAPVTIIGSGATITLSSAGVLAVSGVASLANTVTDSGAGDWVFNQANSGTDIVFQVSSVEQGRFSHGASFNVAFGLKVLNGAALLFPHRNNSLGSSNLNDFNNGLAVFNRWTAGGAINVTGMVALASNDGEVRLIWNVGGSAITLTNQDAASAAANRWLTTTGANLVLNANQCALAVYDSTTAAWRVSLLP